MRRDFTLPEEDMEWLDIQGSPFELVSAESSLRVVIYDFKIPVGYNTDTVTANVRIETGYPDSQIDMVYFSPDLVLLSGRSIGALNPEQFDGKTWQRWSRHRTPLNPWRPGVDNLATHFALVQDWLERETKKA